MEWIDVLMGGSVWEKIAFVTGILYLLLAIRENIWCWVFGLISVLCYLVVFSQARLYSEAGLQVFYAILSVYGWLQWRKKDTSSGQVTTAVQVIHRATSRQHALFWVLGALGTVLLGAFWSHFGADLPYLDAGTTSFSILTTFLVARKILENWLYWILIDTVSIGMYIYKDLWLTALLFFIYAVMAIWGWFDWYRKWQKARHQPI